jgi:hypothetical protein
VQLLFNAGILAINEVAEPGTQGATVFGIQGIGVSTPKAAAVAAATIGLAIELHIAKGGMFAIGMLSIILAAGMLLVRTLFFGNTIKVEGAIPKVQLIMAPIQTSTGIIQILEVHKLKANCKYINITILFKISA